MTINTSSISNNYNHVYEAFQNIKLISKKNIELQKKYRSRARQMPSMLHSLGLLGMLSYLYSKSGNNTYDIICKKFKNTNKDEDNKSIKERDYSIENESYAYYLYHIIQYIEKYHLRNNSTNINTSTNIDANNLDTLIVLFANNGRLLAFAEFIVEPFVIELKKFSESLLEAEV